MGTRVGRGRPEGVGVLKKVPPAAARLWDWRPWAGSAEAGWWSALKGSLRLQGCGGEAPGSLRQPHPSDYIHVSQDWGHPNAAGADWRSFRWGKPLLSQLSLTFSAMSGKERLRRTVRC